MSIKSGKGALFCGIPYPEQTIDWIDDLQDRYCAILEKADGIKYINSRFTDNCYAECARILVDRSGLVLAFQNGELRGVPRETVRYAEETGIAVRTYSNKDWGTVQ